MEIKNMINKTFIESSLKEYFVKKRGCKILFPSEFDEKISTHLRNIDLIFKEARNLILVKILLFSSTESYV
ncbi:MAG TPA: hypothetical protein ENG40_01960, partial [Thermoprotei archaeon]|nr:hypothetical protein [Thermoprotei archaeon]